MEAFRGHEYLRAIRDVCPELAHSAPGALHSERLPELRAVIGIDSRRHDGVYAWADALDRACDVRPAALASAQAAVSDADVCFILYTSGSTATPKGVMLTHGGVIANGFDIGERQHLTAADRVWLAVPLFWSFGAANALPAIVTHGGADMELRIGRMGPEAGGQRLLDQVAAHLICPWYRECRWLLAESTCR